MEYTRLGSAGLKVSRICLGMMSYGSQAERAWHLDETAAEPIVKAAIDGGVTFFDTADTYSGGVTEQITGSLLGRLFGRREDYVLATKVYFPMGPGPNDRGLSRKHVLAAIDASLQRLGLGLRQMPGAFGPAAVAHHAQADPGDLQARGPKPYIVHCCLTFSLGFSAGFPGGPRRRPSRGRCRRCRGGWGTGGARSRR